MRKTALTFELPKELSTEQFISKITDHLSIEIAEQYTAVKRFYDSFDWRLYHAGMSCEFNQSAHHSQLSLNNIAHPQVLMTMDVAKVPCFAADFIAPDFRQQLTALLDMRALVEVASLDYQHTQLNIYNADQKTILRLSLDHYTQLPTRVTVQVIKGYNKHVLPVISLLEAELNLIPVKQPLLISTLKSIGKTAGDYSSKVHIQLDPDMPSELACKYIYSHLLNAMRLNEHGCIEQIDSEFLHDFRVATRRTRSGLSQIKGVLPQPELSYFLEFFSWLGQITGPARDIDVYLLNFDSFKSSLPISIREDLNPLKAHLLTKQQAAYQQLATHLQSVRYTETLQKWENFLREPTAKTSLEPCAKMPVKQLSDHRIWKVYKKLLSEAKTIKHDSPATALHNLRKTGKKLRYLIEFFQQLYPDMDIKQLLKSLKGLQEVLGDFQDYELQERALKQFSIELKDQGVAVETFLAMGVLIQILDKRKHKAREAYAANFEVFKGSKNQRAFKQLFAPSK